MWIFQTQLSEKNAVGLLKLNLSDVQQDVIDASDEHLLQLSRQIAADLNEQEAITSEYLYELTEAYDVTEINYVNPDGIITATTYPAFQYYDMRSGEQSAEFMVLLSGAEEYVQRYQSVSYNAALSG